jgi:hypothetical protein
MNEPNMHIIEKWKPEKQPVKIKKPPVILVRFQNPGETRKWEGNYFMT